MPCTPKYEIGDMVEHKILGEGIILGIRYKRNDQGFTFFHIYTPKFNRFGYYIAASFKLIRKATAESVQNAQQLLLNLCKPDKPGRYQFGDILCENSTNIYILDNGRQYDDNNGTTYLVYHEDKDEINYMTFTGCAYVKTPSNEYTRKLASKLYCQRMLEPAFSATT